MKLNLFSFNSKLLQIFLLLFSMTAFAQITTVIPLTTSSSGVWTVPCGVTSITVEAWGAGGGGGRRTSNGATGGGGGGAYVRVDVPVSMGTSFDFHVGTGGNGTTDTADSNSGEGTWFGSATYIMAKGGIGVDKNNQNGAAGGSGPGSIVPLGIIKYSGGNGGNTRGRKAGNGGGAAYKDDNGGNGHSSNDEGGGYSEYPGGEGARGGIYWAGDGNPGVKYGGGGGGSIVTWLGTAKGGKGADGFIQITYTVAAGNPPAISAVEAISKDTTDIGCINNQVTLQASGGETGLGVSTLWSKGTVCPDFPFIQEFMGDKYNLTGADVGAGSGGNKIFTATSATPSINEMILPSFTTSTFRYITIRYRIVNGVPNNKAKISFTKGNTTFGVESPTLLNADADWHILNIIMSSTNWNGTITKLQYQFASIINTQVEIDYIVLSNVEILENTNSDDSQITIDATDATAIYRAVRIADQAALCNGKTPSTGCFSTVIERKDKRFTGTGTAWNDQNNWTFSGIPNSSNCVFINSGKNVIVNIPSAEAKSIHVESTGKVSISAGNALTVTNSIINMGDGSNFIINDGGNLLQIEDGAVNTGNITAQKVFTFSTGRQQYNYVSSPTVNTNVKSIYTGVLDNSLSALYYIESNDRFGTSGGNYIAGRALALKEKSTGTEGGTTGNPAKFLGVPFNGTIKYPLAFTNETHGYNLVGNPYPSNLDIENLYDSNAAKINATFYFWDNRGNTEFTQQGSGYNGDNYAKYNAAADTGVGSGVKARGISEANGRVPNRYVKVGTGFLVQAKSADQTLDFNNGMRNSDNSSPGFLGKSNQNGDKDRYWLTLKTPTEMEFMTAVVYLANGSKAIGPEDTETFGGSDDIFTVVDDKNLAIQGLDQFEDTDKLNLGLSFFNTGTYTISIYDKEGIFTNGQSIYLKDKFTGTITNLSQGSYTFETNKGVTEGRFEIIYKPETVLVTDSKVKDGIVVYRDSVNFVVQAPKIIATVEVYDLSGKLITVLKANTNQAVLNASFFNKGGYVLRIKTSDGEITNKKIVK